MLLLYRDEMSLPAERAADEGIRSVLGNNPDIRIYSEHLDTSLFPDPKFQAAQSAWLKSKYRDRKIDLVIAVGLPSQTLLPDIPTVFCGMERNGLSHATLPPNATAVWPTHDFEGTLTAAARLQPGAHQVVVLSGTTPWDHHVEMGPPKHTAAPWDSLGYQLLGQYLCRGDAFTTGRSSQGYDRSVSQHRARRGGPHLHFTGVDSFFICRFFGPNLRYVGWLHRLRNRWGFRHKLRDTGQTGRRIRAKDSAGRESGGDSACHGCLLLHIRLAPASPLWLERKRPAPGQHRSDSQSAPPGISTKDGLSPAWSSSYSKLAS